MEARVKIIECPRDAMQGLTEFIPTVEKIRYLNQLLQVGFDTIDFGSFVSAKAIPQMRDTAEVLSQLDWETSASKLLAIVANTRGAAEASAFDAIQYLGFPLSISETFQQRNTNKSIVGALNTLDEIQNLCQRTNKTLVTYISMGFGNPYNDPFNEQIVIEFVERVAAIGSTVVSLADTIGISTPQVIEKLFTSLVHQFPALEIGVHLHSTPATAYEKIEAAYRAGCRRFDGALKGFGGCPMAKDELVGNLPTELLIDYLMAQGEKPGVNLEEFTKSLRLAGEIFPKH